MGFNKEKFVNYVFSFIQEIIATFLLQVMTVSQTRFSGQYILEYKQVGTDSSLAYIPISVISYPRAQIPLLPCKQVS